MKRTLQEWADFIGMTIQADTLNGVRKIDIITEAVLLDITFLMEEIADLDGIPEGKITWYEPQKTCPQCEGIGVIAEGTCDEEYCGLCGGTGRIKA